MTSTKFESKPLFTRQQLTALLPKPDTAPKQEDDGFASFVRERDEE